MFPLEENILNNVRALNKIEKSFIRFTYEAKKPTNEKEFEEFISEAIDQSFEAFNIRNQIVDNLSAVSELRIIDNDIMRTIDKIKQDDKFYSIAFYETIAELLNKDIHDMDEQYAIDIGDYLYKRFNKLFDNFHIWFDIHDYYYKKLKIGTIVSSKKVPNNIVNYFKELKEAYSFSRYIASVALCRAMLEMVLYDRLSRRKIFGKDSKNITIDVAKEDNLNRYINLAKWNNIMNTKDCDAAHKIRMSANSILHPKDNFNKLDQLDEKDTFDIIFQTIQLIEKLYR